MNTSIEVNGLTKYYGQLLAVDRVSFEVETGEIFGFLGPNGAGKTTTLRMLTNLTRPSEGSALILGMDTVRDSLRIKSVVGIVPEASNVFNELTTVSNLTFTGALYGMRRGQRAGRAAELTGLFDLEAHRNRKAAELSLGLKRRLTIAMSLMHRPSVVFLDEPTSGLDVESSRLIRDIVRDLHRNGVTVFITTHNMEEANQLCHRIAVIDHGNLIAVDTPERLKQAATEAQAVEVAFDRNLDPGEEEALSRLPCVSELRALGDKYRLIASDPPCVLEAIYPFMNERGLKPVSLNTFGPSLEDVFVKLTGKGKEQPANE
ncbi:MAG: ATP-binding cassette domain-containing protein [Actinobacteria bacterium]|nr:ATP-binding cassette domain-containing protein [Actinomycetota bacterium]